MDKPEQKLSNVLTAESCHLTNIGKLQIKFYWQICPFTEPSWLPIMIF
jgi:hypothetical protein